MRQPIKTLAIILVTMTLPLFPKLESKTEQQEHNQAFGPYKNRDLVCLAKNIYHESRGEPFHGKVAVAQVTLNRVRSKNFSSTICGVVYETAQFSWTLHPTKAILDQKAWDEALKIAGAVIKGTLAIPNFNALYFHAKHVKPKWRNYKQLVKTIGNHHFYA